MKDEQTEKVFGLLRCVTFNKKFIFENMFLYIDNFVYFIVSFIVIVALIDALRIYDHSLKIRGNNFDLPNI